MCTGVVSRLLVIMHIKKIMTISLLQQYINLCIHDTTLNGETEHLGLKQVQEIAIRKTTIIKKNDAKTSSLLTVF